MCSSVCEYVWQKERGSCFCIMRPASTDCMRVYCFSLVCEQLDWLPILATLPSSIANPPSPSLLSALFPLRFPPFFGLYFTKKTPRYLFIILSQPDAYIVELRDSVRRFEIFYIRASVFLPYRHLWCRRNSNLGAPWCYVMPRIENTVCLTTEGAETANIWFVLTGYMHTSCIGLCNVFALDFLIATTCRSKFPFIDTFQSPLRATMKIQNET